MVDEAEMTLHVLCDCEFTKAIWFRVLPAHCVASFFASGCTDWIVGNIRNCLNIVTPGLELSLFCGILVWRLWHAGNKLIFTEECAT